MNVAPSGIDLDCWVTFVCIPRHCLFCTCESPLYLRLARFRMGDNEIRDALCSYLLPCLRCCGYWDRNVLCYYIIVLSDGRRSRSSGLYLDYITELNILVDQYSIHRVNKCNFIPHLRAFLHPQMLYLAKLSRSWRVVLIIGTLAYSAVKHLLGCFWIEGNQPLFALSFALNFVCCQY